MFHDVRFPTDIGIDLIGGPGFSTTILQPFSGIEQANQNWELSRHEWSVSQPVKGKTKIDALLAFFYARAGKANSFRLKDFMDYQATAQNIGTGGGGVKIFQLRKQYTSGGYTYNRIITKPVNGTLHVFLNGVEKIETTDWSCVYSTGVITFVSAPGTGVAITATFEFDCHARFDTDKFTGKILRPPDSDGSDLVASWDSIPIIEKKTAA